MFYNKILFSILVLTVSFVTMAKDTSITQDNTPNFPTGKTYIVRVTAPKATVYADENMLVPIGYIANGKTIKIGNPRKINKDLVPLIVFGRIAYIEIKNLSYEVLANDDYFARRGAPREHNIDLVLPEPDEDFSIGNHLFMGLQQQLVGKNFEETISSTDGSSIKTITGLSVSAIHRMNRASFFWGLGFDLNFMSTSDIKFNYTMFTPVFGTSIRMKKIYQLDLMAGIDFSLATDYQLRSLDFRQTSGFVWGPSVGIRAILFPGSRYQLYGQFLYKHYTVKKMGTLRDIENNEIIGLSSISGANLGAGLSISFD